MKVEISSVKAHVAVHFGLEGSVLAGTIEASAPMVETNFEIESPDGPRAGGGSVAKRPQRLLGPRRRSQPHTLRGQVNAQRRAYLS